MKVKRKKRVYQEGESGWGGFSVKEGINLSMFLYMLLVTRQQRERADEEGKDGRKQSEAAPGKTQDPEHRGRVSRGTPLSCNEGNPGRLRVDAGAAGKEGVSAWCFYFLCEIGNLILCQECGQRWRTVK